MTQSAAGGTADKQSPFLPAMLLLFAGSGCSALIYEIVWYQLLQLAIGSTAVSLGVLLATFMGGLCIGSYALPRLFAPGGKRDMHPLKLYAAIEIGIAALGLFELILIPLIDKLYVAGAHSGAPGILLRAIFCSVALLPPTILMGASLPAISRWADSSPRGVSWWGLFYGINTAGAVLGSLLAGFWLLRLYDIFVATGAAALINVAVALVSLALASRVPASSQAAAATAATTKTEPAARTGDGAIGRWSVLVAVGLSGATSMGAQVVWTRLMGLMLGATVYVFSIILAVFLVGLGIGAGLGAWAAKRWPARALLGWSQVLAFLGLAWTSYQIAQSLPYWPVQPLANTAPHIIFQVDLVRVLWALLPATVFWGAAVPLAFAGAARNAEDPGRTVGGVYAANTLGAIAGALIVSLVLIPMFGTQNAQRVLIVTSMAGALAIFAPMLRAAADRGPALVGLATAVLWGPLLAAGLHPVPPELIAYGRRTAEYLNQFEVLESHEGQNTSIAITRWNDNSIQFHVAGKVEASNNPYDMRLQRMLGYMPMLLQPAPKSVLIVGFGAGVTAGSFTTYPTIKRIVICEMEPTIPPTTTKWFAAQNHLVAKDPRTQIVFDDARHFVLTTREKFDVVTSDPIHPFVKGSASLYSKEYFQMLRDHLNPGGVVTQWIPLYESDFATVKSEIATFFAVFPYASVWANLSNGAGYDLVLIGNEKPMTIDLPAVQAQLDSAGYERMKADIEEVGLNDVRGMYDTYAGDKVGLKDWLSDAVINRDRDLRLQYLAGLALNRNLGDPIYKQMLGYKTLPTGLKVIFAKPEATP
jgi:spermidine synthase